MLLLPIVSGEPVRPSTPTVDHETLLVQLGFVLGIKSDYDDEFRLASEKLHDGSCQWLLRKSSFQNWATNSCKSAAHLWISGSPGSGKSTLASFVIQYLQDQSYSAACQHHFFLAADKDKKTLAYMLRSIAYQVALSSELFLTRLIRLSEASSMTFEQEDVSTIWERIFEGLLFRLPSEDPLFRVIDGLDETESPNEMLKLISRVRSAATINILIVSRATKDISKTLATYFRPSFTIKSPPETLLTISVATFAQWCLRSHYPMETTQERRSFNNPGPRHPAPFFG